MNAETALEAIRARINGEWDNPALIEFGPLSTDTSADILAIIELALPAAPTFNAVDLLDCASGYHNHENGSPMCTVCGRVE